VNNIFKSIQLMPKRGIPPEIKQLDKLSLPTVNIHTLSNGIPFYHVDMGTQEVSKIEIVFEAGRPYEKHPMVARATASLLKEGSRHYAAHEVAETLDYYGSTLSIPFNLDTASVVCYSLNKHFKNILPLIEDMLQAPTFSADELDSFKRRRLRKLEIDLSKNDVFAYRWVTELIFGDKHPYGYNSTSALYESLNRDQLVEHFERLYTAGNCKIIASGRLSKDLLALIDERMSLAIRPGLAPDFTSSYDTPSPGGRYQRNMPNSVQASVRVGRKLFNRHHADYHGMYVLNTILGGYFSSRLMSNLREDKGYTYNIYSMMDTMRYDGYFYIGTETVTAHTEETLKQIYFEMQRLREELVGEEELRMVRNYLMGTFLTMLDGPFNVSEIVRALVTEDVPLSFFEELTETVQTISPATIQQLAQKYLNEEDMWEVVVGP
jgi:zinc protease